MAHKKRSIQPIELDGRTLEGGGQLVRTALCLAALTRVPITIHQIRGKRPGGGGLKPQHVACVNWLANATGAGTDLAKKGNKTVAFSPQGQSTTESIDGAQLSPAFREVSKADGTQIYECRVNIGTAGSTGLALQAILPFILFSKFPSPHPVHLVVSGGTNVSGSPSYEYITQVLLPTLHDIGFPQITARLGKRGWSMGSPNVGDFMLEIPPRPSIVLPAFKWRPEQTGKPPVLLRLDGTLLGPSEQYESFRRVIIPTLEQHFKQLPCEKSTAEFSDLLNLTIESSGNWRRLYFILVATLSDPSSSSPTKRTYRLARDCLYERPILNFEESSTEVARRVTRELALEIASGTWVDEHLRDQLIIFQALARGRSEVWAGADKDGFGGVREPSLHTRTAEWVAKELLGVKFAADGTCEGYGFGGDEEKGDLETQVDNLKLS